MVSGHANGYGGRGGGGGGGGRARAGRVREGEERKYLSQYTQPTSHISSHTWLATHAAHAMAIQYNTCQN